MCRTKENKRIEEEACKTNRKIKEKTANLMREKEQ